MMKKTKYDKLEIPKHLSSMVHDAIETGFQKERQKIRTYKLIIGVVIIFLFVFFIPLNTIPTYAKALENIPILNDFAHIFTIKEYHVEDSIKYIDATIPQFTYKGKSDLEKRVNQEINKVIYNELEDSETKAKEYYEAFIKTGGDPADYRPMKISIGYETKCITDEIVSFVTFKSETLANAYLVEYFYNIDMESGKYITLKDLFGSDYQNIVVTSIENTINNWDDSQKALLFKDVNIKDLIDENTSFFVNDRNQVVVVFEKYEVAVGAAGRLEFPI